MRLVTAFWEEEEEEEVAVALLMHEGTREERVNLRTSAIDARGCVTPRDICCKESFLSALKIISVYEK